MRQDQAKILLLEKHYEYFPKSVKADFTSHSKAELARKTMEFLGIHYYQKRQKYIASIYYPTKISGKKGRVISIVEHSKKDVVVAIQGIAVELRNIGYRFEGRRNRKQDGTFLYLNSIPSNWKKLLTDAGLEKTYVDKLSDTVIRATFAMRF